MLDQLEDQGKEIVEKVNHIRALQEQMEAKEVRRGLVWGVRVREGRDANLRSLKVIRTVTSKQSVGPRWPSGLGSRTAILRRHP